MRKEYVFCLLWLMLPVLIFGQESATNTIMTWNIRLDTPYDGDNAWMYRKASFCEHLSEENADIIGFQEVLNSQLIDLQDCLSGYSYVGVGRADGKQGGEYSPVFFRLDRFTLIESGTTWLSNTPNIPGSVGWDAALERIVSWAKLADKKTGDTMVVMNTHFDHVGQKARENSALLMLELAKKLAPGSPLIIMGDLNADPDNPAYKRFISAGLIDARIVATGFEGQRATYTGFDDDPVNDALIDFILHSPHFETIDYVVRPVNNRGQYLSDHLPVVAKLVIKR
jgi:endonuclease/exonuclease/phosphatase family metal-dependent hydrolase